MNHSPDPSPAEKPRSRFKVELPAIIASLALVMSIVSLYQSSSFQKDSSGTDMIKSQYATYYELGRLEIENPQMSHIFAMPNWYDRASRSVAALVGPLDENKREELILKERAFARVIFTHYEDLFFQWRHASRMGDTERVAFLGEALDYYTSRVLRNPRLLYLWSEKGENLGIDFEDETREHYNAKVLHDPALPLKETPDRAGPFEQAR
ncbi:MAG TPA: hypothetical protein VJ725_31035 [Thermoanaerobaculia bacterium]|nr:hypothetical protein [Thermoanaerobaculia bacterium]